jgi:hypothetical protein
MTDLHDAAAEDSATAEAMRTLATLLGQVGHEANEAGVGILVKLGDGCMSAEASPSVPDGEIAYEFSVDLEQIIKDAGGRRFPDFGD